MRQMPKTSALAAALLLGLIAAGPAPAENTGGAAAQVVSVQGDGQFRETADASWKPAEVGQELAAGSFVRTGDYSRMGILFADRTQIRINEKTVLQIKAVAPDSGERDGTVLRLDRGRAWNQSRPLTRGVIMETPSATAAIRGTNWELSVDEAGTSVLSVLEGRVEFGNDLGSVVVSVSEQARAEVGRAPVKSVLVSPEDRVQWVTSYKVDPFRSIVLHSERVDRLSEDLGAFAGDDPERKAVRGAILADLGRWAEARELFASVLADAPGNPVALIGLGFEALRRGMSDEAASFFDRAEGAGAGEHGELLALGRAAALVQAGQYGSASTSLLRIAKGAGQPAAHLILSDISVYGGDLNGALRYAQEGLGRFPGSARIYAQLSRIHLLMGLGTESRAGAENALARDPGSVEGRLALGDLARVEGRAREAMDAYSQAAGIKPAEDRAWYGLGIVEAEREDVRAARHDLGKAIAINPDGGGYQGQLGTLETFANDFDRAQEAYGKALARNPDDYVALTGRGLMKLKRGDTQAGLDDLLKAELIEPRYARVQVYKGIAYYQLGRVQEALDALERAGRLDDKDPMPHLLASVIHTDLLRGDEAVAEARKALELMPYLKSLNQLANDQQGTANLGRSFALMGLDEWSQSYAQESYDPFWAGSHLFLAAVGYDGLFTQNSELFQGLLSDPTVFGAGNRHASLLPRPGHHLTAALRGTQSEDYTGTSPYLAVSGYGNGNFPYAYFLAYENFDLDFDGLPYEVDTFTGAAGLSPSHGLGLFLFADSTGLYNEVSETAGGSLVELSDDLSTDRVDLGLHYRFRPDSNLWIKAASFASQDAVEGEVDGSATWSDVEVDQPEYAVRHTFSFRNRHEVTWGVEYTDRTTDSAWYLEPFAGAGYYALFDYGYTEETFDVYLSDRYRHSDRLLLQADVAYIDHAREAVYGDYLYLPGSPPVPQPPSPGDPDGEQYARQGFYPRLGLVYRFAPARLFRLAYQDWVRPAGFSSLGHASTAGIPLDDRLVMRGGELERVRGQVEWELTDRTFAAGYVDFKEIDNDRFTYSPFTVNELEDLAKLRQRDMAALVRGDLLEFVNTPEYDGGRVLSAGLAVNHLLGGGVGVFGRYVYTDSENTGETFEGNMVPYLPEHAAALGATWMHPTGWYAVTRFIYRTERYSDQENATLLEESWDGAVDIFRESKDKRWMLRLSADEISDRNQDVQYTAEVFARF